MDVRLLIAQTLEGYRVLVLAPGPPCRSWVKTYDSKAHCLTEIAYIDLAPASEIAEALDAQFDENIGMLVLHSDVDPAVLKAAGFVEEIKEYVN